VARSIADVLKKNRGTAIAIGLVVVVLFRVGFIPLFGGLGYEYALACGLLLSFMFFGKGMAKLSAPGAIIIHFFGGIHEIYFPYVLAHPIMIVAMWAGGMSADFVFAATNAGLVATPSPGSIFAYLAVTPPGQHFGVLLGVATGAVASFVVGSLILRFYPVKESEEEVAMETGTPAPVGVPA